MKISGARIVGAAALGILFASSAFGAEPPKRTQPPKHLLAKATFAGGCFWCMQPPFDKLEGVIATTAGYTGGTKVNPTYEEVSSGGTGHAESVQVLFDPMVISYEKLLDVYWHNVDPTSAHGQFCDFGSQYRPAIFTHDDAQKKAADESRAKIEKTKPWKGEVVVSIEPAKEFWAAEEYHQKYYVKNPVRYKYYRTGCGRDRRLRELWGKAAPSH